MGVVRNWRRRMKKLWHIAHKVDYAWRLLDEAEARRQAAIFLRKQLDLPEKAVELRPHPNWRDAVLWMEEYGIVLSDGGAGDEYLARLPKNMWKWDIDPEADPKWYSSWFILKPEKVDDICAWARWPEIAVAQCVLNAKKAGVI